jgi:hypothetical protein
LQARRYISERQEVDEWSPIRRDEAGEVSHYGYLDGLRGLRSTAPLEARPFVLGRVRRRDAATTQLASGTDLSGSAGIDLKWHPTQSLTLDATINADFAQVEADQQVLNLTTYETYYPEKRPFFLEGIDTFATPRQLLYTRRIGRAAPIPTLRLDPAFAEQLVDVPEPAHILGASKLTGALAPNLTIGTLQAVTARNDVDVQLAGGARDRRLIDPLTAFNVLRLKRSLPGNGYVGLMLTSTTRAEPADQYPITAPGSTQRLCPMPGIGGATITVANGARCFDDAYVGSADWRWRSPAGDWHTGGQVIGTMLHGGPPRLVRDGTLIAPGDAGTGGFVFVNKEGGKNWVGDVSFEYEGRKLDYNDLGYNQRANDYRWRFDGEWRDLQRAGPFIERHVRVEYFGRTNLDGLLIGSGYQANVSATFANFWALFTEVHWRPTYYDDREVGDGTALQRAGLAGWEVELDTNPAKPVSASVDSYAQLTSNGVIYNSRAGVLFRLLPALDLEVLPTFTYTKGEPRYVGTGAAPGQLLFGRLEATSFGTTVRATYTFAPRLTLQAYGQLFLAAGHYSEFSSYTPNVAHDVVHLDALTPYPLALASNPDFEEGVLNMNVVLRWEYTLGSTLFLVYTRSQVPSVTLAAGEAGSLSFTPVSRAPAADVVLVKMTYFWAG